MVASKALALLEHNPVAEVMADKARTNLAQCKAYFANEDMCCKPVIDQSIKALDQLSRGPLVADHSSNVVCFKFLITNYIASILCSAPL